MFKALSPPIWAKLISNEAYRWVADLSDKFTLTKTYAAVIDPASVSANTTSEQTFTVAGLNTSDIVTTTKPTHTAGFGIVNSRVSATDTIAITFMNCTASPIDAGSETYLIKGTRS